MGRSASLPISTVSAVAKENRMPSKHVVWNPMFDRMTDKKHYSPSSLRILAKFCIIHPVVSLKQWKITSHHQSNTFAFNRMMDYLIQSMYLRIYSFVGWVI